MQLADVKNALLTVTSNVRKFDGTGMTGNYIVWKEEGQADSKHADGKMKEQAIQGTIDYFTKIDSDPIFDAIQNALNGAGIAFRWESTQYEILTKYIHHEWVWEVPRWLE